MAFKEILLCVGVNVIMPLIYFLLINEKNEHMGWEISCKNNEKYQKYWKRKQLHNLNICSNILSRPYCNW